MSERLNFLFDGNQLLWRCAFAGSREPVWGPRCVSRFLSAVRGILFTYTPHRAFVVWDGPRSPRRTALFPEYKAHRAGTADVDGKGGTIQEVSWALRSLNCRVVTTTKEADDSIYRLSLLLGGGTVVSDDRDFLQMVNVGASVFRPTSGEFVMYETFRERMGMRPEQYLLYRALTGDSADNIPGVPSVGEKTALKLLAEVGCADLEALIGGLLVAPRRRRTEERVLASRDLLERNFLLMDLGREEWGASEECLLRRVIEQRPQGPLDLGCAASLLDDLGMGTALTRFDDWVLPFRRLQ